MSQQQVAYAVPVTPRFHKSFKHIYNIYVRKPICFSNYFTLTHENNNWIWGNGQKIPFSP